MSGDAKPKPVASEPRKRRAIHSSIVRLTHWINAAAMVVMVTSGWQIYNASPIFDFKFPAWMTLGGWLAGVGAGALKAWGEASGAGPGLVAQRDAGGPFHPGGAAQGSC